MGVKLYKGSSSTKNNINVSLRDPINLERVDEFRNKRVKKTLEDLKGLDEEIYAWAAVSRIEKKIDSGDQIVFISQLDEEALLFTYIKGVQDENEEISDEVGWQGHGFKKVVFLKDKKTTNLTSEQFREAKNFVGAEYKSKGGFAGFKGYKQVLSGRERERLLKILNL